MGYICLFVEDLPRDQELVKNLLKTRRFELISANSLPEATAKLEQVLPHALILEMSSQSAPERLEWLQKFRATSEWKIPVVIVSSSTSAEDAKRAAALDIEEYILKPAEFHTLSRRLFKLQRKLEEGSAYQFRAGEGGGLSGGFTAPGTITGVSETGVCIASEIIAMRRVEGLEFNTGFFERIGVRNPTLNLMNSAPEPSRKTGFPLRTFSQVIGWSELDRKALRAWLSRNKKKLQADHIISHAGIKAPNILVIEDNREFLEAISQYLKLQYPDATIVTAEDVKSGLITASRARPDLVILDLHFQGSSGTEFLYAFPRYERAFSVLVLTADKTDEALALALQLGADDYLAKPMDELVLQSKVDSLLSHRYTSPFAFLGSPEGLAPIELKFKVEILGLSEDGARFRSPVSFPRHAKVCLRVLEMEIPVEVVDCDSKSKTQGFFVTAKISEELSRHDMVSLRRMLRSLQSFPSVSQPALTVVE